MYTTSHSNHYHHNKKLGLVYMRPGRCLTGMKIKIVSMFTRDWYENHKYFYLFPLPAIVVFLTKYCRACIVPKQRAQLRPVRNVFVHIHPSLDLSWSEDSQLGPVGGMTSDWSEHFPSQSHVNICYTVNDPQANSAKCCSRHKPRAKVTNSALLFTPREKVS